MTISDMHLLFKLSLDKVGNNALPYFEPEAIDVILNYAIKAVMKQKISGNNAQRTGAEETTKRKGDLQTMMTNYDVTPLATMVNNKPNGVFVALPTDIFYLLDDEVNIGSYVCDTVVTSGNIVPGQLYKVNNGPVTYPVGSGNIYGINDIFIGLHNYTTFEITSTIPATTVEMTRRVNVLPIRNDQYNSLILDPFNRPDENKVLKLEYGIVPGTGLCVELISSKDTMINKYYLRYYRYPTLVNINTSADCDLPEIIHEEIVDFAVNWTLESVESSRFQTQIANISRNE